MEKKTIKSAKKFLSLALALAMFVSAQGSPVLAEEVEKSGVSEISPQNPVHCCTKESDGSDDTDWSYIYFGSYPQSEVTEPELTAALAQASYDRNGDAVVNGERYRRISKDNTNSPDYFGDGEYRYFKWERIKWRVLENNGNTLFVIADKGLDCKPYNKSRKSLVWGDCTLRNWLNRDFYKTAFHTDEQDAIVGRKTTSDNVFLISLEEVTNPEYGFCESYDVNSASRQVQVSDYAHAMGVWTGNSNGRKSGCWWLRSQGNGTGKAVVVNYSGNIYKYGDDVNTGNNACVPALHINLSSDLWSASDNGNGEAEDVVTTLKENAKKELETYKSVKDYRPAQQSTLADSIKSGKTAIDQATDAEGVSKALAEAKETIDQIKTDAQLTKREQRIANPAHHCTKMNDGSDYTDWSYIYFGSYPQSEVTGTELTSAIIRASYDSNGDAVVDGKKYRRIRKSDTNSPYYFGNLTYRYFKWEPVKWRVLWKDDSSLFVLADRGLDCTSYYKNYRYNTNVSVTWRNSTVRSWLNQTFYETVFTKEEQEAVLEQSVLYDGNSQWGNNSGYSTWDKIFLLSIEEVENPDYGFCEDDETFCVGRQMLVSDYAHIMGACNTLNYTDDPAYDSDNCCWLLRSRGFSTADAANVEHLGNVSARGDGVGADYTACVPALRINVSSDLWDAPVLDAEEVLKEAKTAAKTELESYKNAADYRDTQKTELSNAIESGKNAIEAATDEASINEALTVAKAVLDQIKTDAQLTREEQEVTGGGNTEQRPEGNPGTVSPQNPAPPSANVNRPQDPKSSAITKVTLNKTVYVYNGKNKKPSVTVKAGNKTLTKNTDYTVTYKNNKKIGKASAIIQGKGSYTGRITKTFKILPKGTSISGKIIAKEKGFCVKWKKQPKSTAGYQVQYSRNKKFTGKTTVTKTVKKKSTVKMSVKKLKERKKYYVRVRTYKNVKGKKYCSSWSKAKSVKTKSAPKKWKAPYKSIIKNWRTIENISGYDSDYMKQYFGSDYRYDKYFLCDVDGNKTPELFLYSSSMNGMTAVFTYSGGRVVCLGCDSYSGINKTQHSLIVRGHWHGAGGSGDMEYSIYKVKKDRLLTKYYIDNLGGNYTVCENNNWSNVDRSSYAYNEVYQKYVVGSKSFYYYAKYAFSNKKGLNDCQ